VTVGKEDAAPPKVGDPMSPGVSGSDEKGLSDIEALLEEDRRL